MNAVKDELPNIPHVFCWNHILRDIRYWLRKHGAPAVDIAVYIEDVCSLFHSTSQEVYTTRLAQYQRRWDAQFEEYYTKEIHPDSIHSTARWRLEQLDIYNPYSGVTNNQSESLNRVIKDFQGWREAPIDCIVLALHQLLPKRD